MKVAPVRVYGNDHTTYVDTYAVLDSAAGDCLCSKELMDMLGLEGEPRPTVVIPATGTTEISTAHYLTMDIRGYRTKKVFQIQVIALDKLTDLSEHIPCQADIDRHPHMRGIKIPEHPRKKVDILICIGESQLQHTYDTRTAAAGQLWASCSGLGWVVHGRDSNADDQQATLPTVGANACEVKHDVSEIPPPDGEQEILEKVRQTYAIDYSEPQHSQKKLLSRKEQEMLQRQQKTFRIVDGRCEVGKLWKRSPHELPSNRWMAEQSLRQLGRRLQRNAGLLKQYQEFIGKLVANNQARIASAPLGTRPGWFLLHHPVLSKFRVVFNGKASCDGYSLNDFLDKGPEHTSSLLGTVLRFRQGKYAASADIKGMFYNVGIPAGDRDYMRFLWWKNGDPSKEIIEYTLDHQVPGLTDSGSNSCFALRALAESNPANVSKATCDAVKGSFYVDDLAHSGSDLQGTQAVLEQMTKALAAGGFHLTKFVANHQTLLAGIPEQNHKPHDPGALHKILGIKWDTHSDRLQVQFNEPTQQPTRRGILSYIMSPFDPIGIALPYLLDMKRLVQRLFSGDWGWDTLITGDDLEEWNQWIAELPRMGVISCKRTLIPEPGYKAIYLCVFSDASQRGIAANAYIVCEYINKPTVSFALGKVRVAPNKKQVTIPRLELLAAVLGVELASSIKEELDIQFTETLFWTDSTTVLHWVKNPNLQLKAFVANRVAKIIEGSEGATWSHVPTKENPADVGSRGLRPSDKEGIKLWLEGPSWLRNGRASWPLQDGLTQLQPTSKDLEIKKINATQVKPKSLNQALTLEPLKHLFGRYSTLEKLKTTAAWLLRLRRILQTKSQVRLNSKSPLTAEEMDDALINLVRAAQWAGFPALMQAFSTKPPLAEQDLAAFAKKQQRNMRELAPYLDEYGLLRVGGRLQRAGLSFEQTHPLILPKRHELTGLLIDSYHRTSLHRGYNYVLARLRERFWVIGGTGTVRHYLAKCIRCRHTRAPLGSQKMAPLPPSRFQVGKPAFTYTAVDYFGPLQVRAKRSAVKRWGCLMTCLTTRAVHLEVAHSLETDSFKMAFQRFSSAYPSVTELLSDNGTNFVGADRELREEFSQAVRFEDLAIGLRQRGINFRWKFNPPASSHQGGVFERMIGLVRSCLRQTMKDISYRTPSDEGLLTMLKGIEGILNLRPLLPAGLDPGSYDVLTPAQIIRPGTPAAPMALRQYNKADALKQGYRSSQWHVDEFWRRFSAQYIPLLQKQAKWHQPHRNFREGDLVLIQDKNAPRHNWRMALISKVHPNPTDGLVRCVTLRQSNGPELRRDIRHICLLEASPELEVLASEDKPTEDAETEA